MKDARPGQGISIRVTLTGYKTPCWRPVQARTFDHSVSQRGLLASIRIQKSEKDTDKMGSLTDDAEAAHPTFLFFGDSIWPSVLTSLWHSRHQAHDLGSQMMGLGLGSWCVEMVFLQTSEGIPRRNIALSQNSYLEVV